MSRFARSLALLLSLQALLFAADAHAHSWSKLPTSGPAPSERSAPAVAAALGTLFVFGGVKDDFAAGTDTFYDDLYALTTWNGQWRRLAATGPKPAPRGFAAAAAHIGNPIFFVFGGAHYGPFFSDFVAYNDLWAFDLRRGAWRQLTATNAGPEGRSSPKLWVEGDSLYVFGGITSTFTPLNDLWRFDLVRNEWTLLSPQGAAGAPPPRHEAMGDDQSTLGKLIIYGGETVDETFTFQTLNDVWQYDLQRHTWTEVRVNPAFQIAPPRNYAASSIFGTTLYLHGGDVPAGDAGCGAPFPQNATAELWAFDLLRRRWELLPAGPSVPRLKRHRGGMTFGRLYMVGGYDFVCPGGVGPGQVWNKDVLVFDP